jgi:hypothetical protein
VRPPPIWSTQTPPIARSSARASHPEQIHADADLARSYYCDPAIVRRAESGTVASKQQLPDAITR